MGGGGEGVEPLLDAAAPAARGPSLLVPIHSREVALTPHPSPRSPVALTPHP
jgi:hypothetical protein